jgi:hypothetical protein
LLGAVRAFGTVWSRRTRCVDIDVYYAETRNMFMPKNNVLFNILELKLDMSYAYFLTFQVIDLSHSPIKEA